MEFVLVIYQPWELLDKGGFSEEEGAEVAAKYGEILATPGVKANFPLGFRKDATTVRVKDGQTITRFVARTRIPLTRLPPGRTARHTADRLCRALRTVHGAGALRRQRRLPPPILTASNHGL
jgi:hypothetical protein